MALFPIMIEVEEPAVGSVLRLLKDYPGIAKLHLDLDNVGKKPIKRQSHSGSRQKRDPEAPRGKDIIITELLSGPKNLQHLRDRLAAYQMSSGNLSSALNELRRAGITESGGAGVHRLTQRAMDELKPRLADESAQISAPKANGEKIKSIDFVLDGLRKGMSRAEIRRAGEPIGINERMVDGALTRLKVNKLITRGDEEGHYKLTAKATKDEPKQS